MNEFEKTSLDLQRLLRQRRGMSTGRKAGIASLVALLTGGGVTAAATQQDKLRGLFGSDPAGGPGTLSYHENLPAGGPINTTELPRFMDQPWQGSAEPSMGAMQGADEPSIARSPLFGPERPGISESPWQGPAEPSMGPVQGPVEPRFMDQPWQGPVEPRFMDQPWQGPMPLMSKHQSVRDPYYYVNKVNRADKGYGLWGRSKASSSAFTLLTDPCYGAKGFVPHVVKQSSPDGKITHEKRVLASLLPALDMRTATLSASDVALGLREKQSRGFEHTLRGLLSRPRPTSGLRKALTVGGLGALGLGAAGAGVGGASYLAHTGQLPAELDPYVGDNLRSLAQTILDLKGGGKIQGGPGVADYHNPDRPSGGPGVADYHNPDRPSGGPGVAEYHERGPMSKNPNNFDFNTFGTGPKPEKSWSLDFR